MHSRARAELQELLLGVLAHELGNVTSPVGFAAETIAIATNLERAMSVVGALRNVSGRLGELTAVARLIRDTDLPPQPSFSHRATLSDWTRAQRAFVEGVLPRHCVLDIDCTDVVPTSHLDTLFWPLMASARFVAVALPATRRVLLRAGYVAAGDAISIELRACGACVDTPATGLWLRYARRTSRTAGIKMRVHRLSDAVTCRLEAPAPSPSA